MGETAIVIVRTVAALRDAVAAWRKAGETVGLVPTMGALHRGHLALVGASTASCRRTVASIFVNPTQFGAGEDLARYPRREAEDVTLLAENGCELVFAPPVAEMYPDGFATTVHVGGVTEPLEGAHRPGHFDGVATVVSKLLLQCLPDRAFFGEKDYQQLVTIKRMVRDLDIPAIIEGVPIVREDDGLALSSRNEYLTSEQRAVAPALNRTLVAVAEAAKAGADIEAAEGDGIEALYDAGFDTVDYVALRAADDLSPMATLDRPARVLAAAILGKTRLIDNVAVG
jgi:pantoate--beta-alanine ligase